MNAVSSKKEDLDAETEQTTGQKATWGGGQQRQRLTLFCHKPRNSENCHNHQKLEEARDTSSLEPSKVLLTP